MVNKQKYLRFSLVLYLKNLLMEKLEHLNDELEKSGRGATKQNPIVGSVLMQAARAMGLPKNDEDTTDDNDDDNGEEAEDERHAE